ncbi:CotY/CotZ family spore coat protein [Mesobacillus subterraneus]|uniref:CotY/CotZ family spore coat protein n=1 Tax=Mesobacillus subterraneus TaxID=285983 RepID=UPI00273FE118|nr:CotY/CotZ family spore coat protein [Mesobacillus subterraneus]WLR56874.1 CotY/CotZ family spore coat protein [Mesobacillus subterraneus]
MNYYYKDNHRPDDDYSHKKEKSHHHDKHKKLDDHRDWNDHEDWKKHRVKDKHIDWDDDSDDCGCKKSHHYEKHSHPCVCKKVRDINEAQHKVKEKNHGCDVSCERSIRELLNQCKQSNYDTIPFKLLCGCSKGDCETFVGTGVVKINDCFYDIKSTFFRVVDFTKGSKCCAILELLCPERCESKHHGIEGFVRTGACFEVDLKDFVGITCFPPVKAKKMDPLKILCSGR